MNLKKIDNWEFNRERTPNITTYEDGEVVIIEGYSLGKYDEVRKILSENHEISDHLPSRYGTNVYAEVHIGSKGDSPITDHREIFIRGYEMLIQSGYTCDVKELFEEYDDWFYKQYRYRPETKSEINKAWNNELGHNINEDIEWKWSWYIRNKCKELDEEARQEQQKEIEETKVSVFDTISEVA